MTAGRPFLVPLGGFLGSGKTTLILAASRLLASRGMRAAAVLNDQGADLVDTRFVERNGVDAGQVSGGCFCCRFSDLVEVAGKLRAHAPHVIFIEAVGSCTDISATVLQPLKREFANQYQLAPYSVLVDPGQAPAAAPDGDDISFLFWKQVEEADLICFTKTDIHNDFPAVTGAPVRYLSPLTGQGVAEWLDEILSGRLRPGSKVLEIDYRRYARAEAALAWLNCTAAVHLEFAQPPAELVGPLLERLDSAIAAAGLRLVHLKLLDETPSGYIKAALIQSGEEPVVEGMLLAEAARKHELLLNVRAEGPSPALREAVERVLRDLRGKVRLSNMQSFQPAPPNPERRLGLL